MTMADNAAVGTPASPKTGSGLSIHGSTQDLVLRLAHACVLAAGHSAWWATRLCPLSELLSEWYFWREISSWVLAPAVVCVVWRMFILESKHLATTVLKSALILVVGDAVVWAGWNAIRQTDVYVSGSYGWLWSHWGWIVFAAVNLRLAWGLVRRRLRSRSLGSSARPEPLPRATGSSWLHWAAGLSVAAAAMLTAFYAGLPRLSCSPWVLDLARTGLTPAEALQDFDSLRRACDWREIPMGVM